MSEFKLTSEIIARSEASRWDEAKLEWTLQEIYHEEEPQTCLCGHFPINEICVIGNSENGGEAVVGNVCVKKFLGLPSDQIFRAIKKIREDDAAALNPDAISHAHRKGWINDWERSFYIDTWRKRKLSGKQLTKRIQINKNVLKHVTNRFGGR